MVRVLDPDVVLRSDGGGVSAGVARRPVIGADHVARLLLGVAARHAAMSRAGTVNGSPGLVFEDDGGVVGVRAFTVAGLITEIDFVFDATFNATADRRFVATASIDAPVTVAFGSRDLLCYRTSPVTSTSFRLRPTSKPCPAAVTSQWRTIPKASLPSSSDLPHAPYRSRNGLLKEHRQADLTVPLTAQSIDGVLVAQPARWVVTADDENAHDSQEDG